MTSDKYIATLRQIRAIVDDALREDSSGPRTEKRAAKKGRQLAGTTTSVSFEINILAFMSKHAKGLSGPKKFTLLVARIVKGSTAAQVKYQDIEAQWNKMKSVLGGALNPAHGNRAKKAGWVDSEKGQWKLTGSWKDALA